LVREETIMINEVERPNIILVFSDQQRWDTLGCYGQQLDVTPNLDRIAAEGVRFENAFTCQPVCGPARSCLQTGKYATETGCYRNNIALPLDAKTIAHYLGDVNYEVAYIGKWHLASTVEDPWNPAEDEADYLAKPIPPWRRGGYRDYWLASDLLEFTSHSYDGHMFNAEMEPVLFPEGRYRVDAQTDFALDYLRGRREHDRPFFLFVSYLEPHHQNDHHRYEGPKGSKERFGEYEVPPDLKGTQGDWRENYADYLGCINSLDRNVGRMRAELEALGRAEDTLIIYTSDHGSHFRTRNEEYKRSCHESSVRIPMLAYGAGFEGGRVITDLVSLIDLTPTLLTAAKTEVPSSMRGRPLQTLMESGIGNWRDEVFIQISESQVGRAIRTQRWKYSVYAPGRDGWTESSSDRYVEQYLYDLEDDPYEHRNLVRDPEYAHARARLRETLKRRVAEVEGETPEILPA
jgi:arylsulfatase A-like enzyme